MIAQDKKNNRQNAIFFFILKRFPEHYEQIQQLLLKNDTFRSLCEDYRVCAKALRYWNESTSKEATMRREEYRALLEELEEEILVTLEEN